ncbi:hypothetical protein QR680_005040 [Steinernema hermaphroditum]|uniref:BD-FAE-like domain-containing protein n=1 Tax=Steinernema hermaphroditum TaxID=289476 RepID=A0AA39LU65_9BILA|nr:hypothetical protein QR680_005040 [Steinernema hermaphroditum]
MVVREKLSPLEIAFSPSCFPDDPELSPEQVVERFLKVLEDSLAENRSAVAEREEDVVYAGGRCVDFWGPTTASERVFVAIHGGYWQEGDRKYFTTMVKPLVDSGITVAVIGYDLAPKVTIREQIDQVKEAVTFVLNRCPHAMVAVGGHSAGAHLAALAVSEMPKNNRLVTLVLICGVFCLNEIVDTYIGRDIQLTPDTAKKCNLDMNKLIEKFGLKKIVFLNSEFDAEKLKLQNEELEAYLRSNGAIRVECTEIRRVDHFSIIEDLRKKEHPACQALLSALL